MSVDFPNKQALFAKIADELAENNFSVTDNFFPLPLFKKVRKFAETNFAAGLAKPANIGRMNSLQLNQNIRGDNILWIENNENSPAEITPLFATLDDLRKFLNQALYLPMSCSENHFAHYPKGTFYQKHLDCHKNSDERILTFILYLNRRNWSQNNGGELRFWHDESHFTDFSPVGNRLILFSSPKFYHEVLPALNDRYSFTGWFRRTSVKI